MSSIKKKKKIQMILEALESAGYKRGVSNAQLAKITHRFGALIHYLRTQGYVIDTLERGDGLYTYHLRLKMNPIEKPKAIDVLHRGLTNEGFHVSADRMVELVDELGLSVQYFNR